MLAILLAAFGCVASKSVECASGVICPERSVCDAETNSCVQPQGLVVDEGIIDLESVLCGDVASKAVRLSNFGDAPIAFVVRSTLDQVTLDPTEGTVPAGQTLQVTATADLTAGPATPGLFEGAVIVTTGEQVIPRVLQLGVGGAELTTDATSYDFGSNGPGGEATVREVTLSNLGEAGATVNVLSSDPDFSVVGAASFTIEGGESASVGVGYSPNAALGTYAADIEFAYSGPLCNEPPQSIPAQAVVSGAPILLSANQLDFSPSPCGAASADKTLTISSQLAQAIDIDFDFSGDAPNLYAPIANTPVPQLDSVDISVVRQAISPNATPANTTTTTLTISEVTGTMGIAPVPIDAVHQIVAPAVSTNVDSLNFETLEFNDSAQLQFEVENSGNGMAQFSISPSSFPVPGGGFIQVSSTSFMLAPGETRLIDVIAQAGNEFVVSNDINFTIGATSACGSPKLVSIQLAVIGGNMLP